MFYRHILVSINGNTTKTPLTHTDTERQTTLFWLTIVQVQGLPAVLGDDLHVSRIPEVAQGVL